MLERQDEWAHIMRVNAMAPVAVAELLLPCVVRSTLQRIIMISSIMGSITHVSPDVKPDAIACVLYRTCFPSCRSFSSVLCPDTEPAKQR
jgi:hypothetical protein